MTFDTISSITVACILIQNRLQQAILWSGLLSPYGWSSVITCSVS